MEELFAVKNGYTPDKSNAAYWTSGTIPWFRMDDIRINGRVLSDSLQHITELAVKGGTEKLFPANSLLVATTATIGEHALVTVPHLANQRFTSLTVKPGFAGRVDMKYLYYYCFLLAEWCRNNTNTSSFPSVNMGAFKSFRFRIPSLTEQRRIVSMLDRFESLTSSLSSGLPAEIAARRRQYEFYRDQLLGFDENER